MRSFMHSFMELLHWSMAPPAPPAASPGNAHTPLSPTASAPPFAFESFSRSSLAQRFLNVSKQLEALQPPVFATQQCDVTADASALLLPTHERIHRLLLHNESFRPCEDAIKHPATPATERKNRANHDNSAMIDSTEQSTADTAKQSQANASVYVPVGGKARAFPSSDLSRAKAALRRQSHALANLNVTAMDTLSPDKRKALHMAPGGAWDLLRQTAAANAAQQQPGNSYQRKSTSAASAGKQALIAELVGHTQFTTQSIFHISRKFKSMAAGSAKSVIAFEEFRQIMSEDMGSLLSGIAIDEGASASQEAQDMSAIGATISASETFLRRLFLTFDGDGDGKIDFREFVVGLNGFVKGTPQEKVRALFALYQHNDGFESSGNNSSTSNASQKQPTVAISDLLGLFQGDRQLYQELMRCVDEYFVRVEVRDESTMTEEEFVAASVGEPHLLEVIARPLPSLKYASDERVRELVRLFMTQNRVTWKTLLHIYRRLASSRPLTAAGAAATEAQGLGAAKNAVVSAGDFHHILLECLGANAVEDEALSQSLTLAYVASARENQSAAGAKRSNQAEAGAGAKAYVSGGEFTQDLAVALQNAFTAELDLDAKARYFFEVFDHDRDGLLSRTELCAAVCAGFAHFGQNVMDVVRVLEEEDVDMDGEVTMDEYVRAAERSPTILASLYTFLPQEEEQAMASG